MQALHLFFKPAYKTAWWAEGKFNSNTTSLQFWILCASLLIFTSNLSFTPWITASLDPKLPTKGIIIKHDILTILPSPVCYMPWCWCFGEPQADAGVSTVPPNPSRVCWIGLMQALTLLQIASMALVSISCHHWCVHEQPNSSQTVKRPVSPHLSHITVFGEALVQS